MKPRSEVVVRRFLAGESLAELCEWLEMYAVGDSLAYVESCIRRALGRKAKR